ncbi:HxlR family transcriptional regulator [Niastella yeongjuensis]|uniref:HxlR family transcriptional regulator n=1 Tax=Niastella yeongjuensis TaxID=354355 RepID=A0A1V9F4Z0_9BACT|nr:helix-turn-helix domain-containing protein [Niastella yeongjuensis]OQP53460.1 HxlR family transcriptional regulator [Niastella yeongjuensis]SEP11693.1 transcriptional regulator, HxlR family [Niastella yeongjuensis]
MDYDRFKYCGLNVALDVLSGKWKPVILFHLFHEEEVRFTELWRNIPKVAKKVLLEQLKQMEEDGVIIREERNTFPPEVYYRISEKGKALGPALAALQNWATEHAAEEVAAMRAAKKVAL